ncbi:RNA-binding domain superfamily [Arabidopsis suecica]|uniref:RNA-binding domain superfamily n=1 Tax=Arabidopsis suecica TaxID=45249 RepID=A0A8T2B561_ARASU|nr:RNA-binding domain superfamily [Arabidopsis suecica]
MSHIYIPRNFEKGILKSFAFVDFATEGAVEKALKLSGSAVEGGWRVFVKESPFNGDYIDPGWADVSFKHFSSERELIVSGYDSSLPEIDLQIGLSKHFSSCGEVTGVTILPTCRKATIFIREEGAAEKALELSGRDMGGWNITVECVMPPMDSEKNFPTSNRAPPSILGIMKKMRKKMKKMKKKTTE